MTGLVPSTVGLGVNLMRRNTQRKGGTAQPHLEGVIQPEPRRGCVCVIPKSLLGKQLTVPNVYHPNEGNQSPLGRPSGGARACKNPPQITLAWTVSSVQCGSAKQPSSRTGVWKQPILVGNDLLGNITATNGNGV